MSSTSPSTKRRRKARRSKDSRSTAHQEPSDLNVLRLPYHDWEAWTEHLEQRDAPPDWLQSERDAIWLWGVAKESVRASLAELVEFLRGLKKKGSWKKRRDEVEQRLQSFLEEATAGDSTPERLLEALVWTSVSPSLAWHLPETRWLELTDKLQTLVRRLPGISPTADPWTFHLTAELALTMAHLYPEVSTWAGQWTIARDALSHGICEWTDQEGLPVAPQLGLLRPLIACWTRCQRLADTARQPSFHREARKQVVWCARQTLALTRHDGTQVLESRQAAPWDDGLFRGLLQTFEDRRLRSQAHFLPCLADRLKPKDEPKENLPRRASNISEWAKIACLRSDWSQRSPRFAVTFDQHQFRSEFSLGKHELWSGSCQPEVTIDGQLQTAAHDLEVVCTFHDKEVEYLEVQMKLDQGWKLQRQMVLAVRDEFLLLADALIGPEPAKVDYVQRLPLTSGTELERARESREGWLRTKDERRVLVLPLALPEWRVEPSMGELEEHDGRLALRQSATGRALFCPLFFDFSKRRRDKPYTWRRLTVAEELARVPHDVAVGFRAQVGRDQWLVYRSLGRRFSRSVLGQHLLQEFVVGRFPKSGELDLLLQVESADE